MDDNILLDVKNLSKDFFGITVLQNVNFQLYEGEIISLVGENGAGKSTLVKIITGIYPHGNYGGNIYHQLENNGVQELALSSVREANDIGIAMIYQEISVEYDLTVAENIMLGHWKKNKYGLVDWKSLKQEASKVLEKLNFDLDLNENVRTLSASQQQIVCIARALMRNPKILILDEPTASLTEKETEVLFEIIRTLQEKNISCIYISHRLSEVLDISNRIIVLRDGHIISQYEKKEFDKDKIISDMIGKNLDVRDYKSINIQKTNPILSVRNLVLPSVVNKNMPIIDGISFDLYRGEILGIVGTLGSGRSEILRSIYGAYRKIEGKIYKHDKEIVIHSPQDALLHGIGFLTEERKKDGYVGTMNIKANTSLNILKYLKIMKYFLSFSKEKHLVHEYLQKMKYRGPSYEHSILSLSGGNQQKVIFSKILMAESDILLLDEPTRGIDVGAKEEIYTIIEELREKGKSFIIVSSELPETIRLCTRVVILHDKKINAELDRLEMTEQKILHLATFSANEVELSRTN